MVIETTVESSSNIMVTSDDQHPPVPLPPPSSHHPAHAKLFQQRHDASLILPTHTLQTEIKDIQQIDKR